MADHLASATARIKELEAQLKAETKRANRNFDAHQEAIEWQKEAQDVIAWAADRVAKLRLDRNRLLESYAEAIEDIADWAGYADEYFQEKHDLSGTLEQHKAVIDEVKRRLT